MERSLENSPPPAASDAPGPEGAKDPSATPPAARAGASAARFTDDDALELSEEQAWQLTAEQAEPEAREQPQDLVNPAPSMGLPLRESLPLRSQVEAIIFASPQPIKATEILEFLQCEGLSMQQVVNLVDQLRHDYSNKGGGFRLEHLPGRGYQFQTVAAASILMERMFSERPRPLSRAAQETLAIIAYRQPVTRADIEFIRGVDAGSIIKNLLERELIKCTGRREDAGRPMLFGTSDEFLKVYRMSSLGDLPPLEAFQPESDRIKSALDKIGAEHSVDVESMIMANQGADSDFGLEDDSLATASADEAPPPASGPVDHENL